MIYYHVDVFSNKALSGNGLSVIFMDNLDNTDYMQALAKEFKQFESVFLKEESEGCFRGFTYCLNGIKEKGIIYGTGACFILLIISKLYGCHTILSFKKPVKVFYILITYFTDNMFYTKA